MTIAAPGRRPSAKALAAGARRLPAPAAPAVGRALRALGLAAALSAVLACAAPGARAEEDPAGPRIRHWSKDWATDFSRRTVDLTEIVSGGVPRDGIPALDRPAHVPAAAGLLPEAEPVLAIDPEDGPPRAWALRHLMWHEIVNDAVAGRPVAATWCPLCNSALVFEARLPGEDGRDLSFGVTGKLRASDMVMYDRETESWWQQIEGEAIAGELAGARLERVPSWIESYGRFRAREGARIMAEPEGWERPYGVNPYRGYDTAWTPFLYNGDHPPHGIEALARVVRVGGRAWPLARIAEAGTLEEAGLRFEWSAGMASALDAERVAEGRDVGMVRVFDAATGAPAVAEVIFAFAFHAFHPEGEWMLGEDG